MRKTIAALEKQILELEMKCKTKDDEINTLISILSEYEKKLSFRRSGSLYDRLEHVLSQFESVSHNSMLKTKDFIDDVKTQFKALELVVEGISNEGYNHSMKRVIANHVINLLRDMVQRINQIEFNYSSGIYDRYDWFRSHTPERRLYEKYKEMKAELEQYKKMTVESGDQPDELPF